MELIRIRDQIFHIFNIVFGLIIIGLGIIIMVFSTLGLLTLVVLLSLGFTFSGIGRLIAAFYNKKLNKYGVIIKIITGFIAIAICFFIFIVSTIDPNFSVIFLINLGFVLFLFGIARVFMGILTKKYQKSHRYILIFVGVISIILGIVVMIVPAFGYYVLISLISIILILNGLVRLTFRLFEND